MQTIYIYISKGITKTNDLIYAGAVVLAEALGLSVRKKKGTKPKEPLWKRRLTCKTKA